jgi:hypothetical protein
MHAPPKSGSCSIFNFSRRLRSVPGFAPAPWCPQALRFTDPVEANSRDTPLPKIIAPVSALCDLDANKAVVGERRADP